MNDEEKFATFEEALDSASAQAFSTGGNVGIHRRIAGVEHFNSEDCPCQPMMTAPFERSTDELKALTNPRPS